VEVVLVVKGYGDKHFLDLEDFYSYVLPNLLDSYTKWRLFLFFNGLALDNLFSHGRVACQCVKLQLLASLGFEAVFVPCEITVLEQAEWEGIRRKYWYGCNTYNYLPHVTWKATDETTTSRRKDKGSCIWARK
jgi:hypothetical protein